MRPRTILSIGNFFFSIFSTLIGIILLPYLSLFMPSAYTGFVLVGGAAVTIMLFPFLPRLIERVGAQQLVVSLALVEIAVLFTLAAAPGALAAILLLAATVAVQPFLSYEFDILMEATLADTGSTGEVRALFRSSWNIAALAAPLLIGAILVNSDSYGRIFILAAAMLAPIVVLLSPKKLPTGPAPKFAHARETLLRIVHNQDLSAVMFGNLLLYLFYVWMPVYTPVYLHDVLNIPWSSLGWIFAVMLIPYVVIEYPAAWVADRILGDKELMFAGFIIAGSGLAALSFVTASTSLITIAIILISSRVGAALTESMVDGHFFRRVSKRDISSIGVYRAVWPLSYIIAPIVASLFLLYTGYSTFFLWTGAFIAVAGVISTLFIQDFR